MKKFIMIVLVSLITSNIGYTQEMFVTIDDAILNREVVDDTISSNVIEDILSGYVIVPTESQLRVSKEISEADIECMAQNIYFEAGNEPYIGKVAVAQVTVNRTESGKYPTSICDVVKQKTRAKSTGRIVCQFSWYCETKKRIRYNSDQWISSLNVAREVLINGARQQILNNALFYHNTHVNPRWGLPRITKIGGHIFYRAK